MMTSVKVLVAAVLLAVAPSATAGLIPVQLSDFPSGSPVITFGPEFGPLDGTSADGATVERVTFHYPAGGLIFDGGPGITNNLDPMNLVSGGPGNGVLTMNLQIPTTMLGFGWAVISADTIPDALKISVFHGATFLGSLDYGGAPDPNFTGGFAGIQSSVVFDRVDVTFAASGAPAFALDNIIQVVPEPSTLFVGAPALAALALLRRRRSTR